MRRRDLLRVETQAHCVVLTLHHPRTVCKCTGTEVAPGKHEPLMPVTQASNELQGPTTPAVHVWADRARQAFVPGASLATNGT